MERGKPAVLMPASPPKAGPVCYRDPSQSPHPLPAILLTLPGCAHCLQAFPPESQGVSLEGRFKPCWRVDLVPPCSAAHKTGRASPASAPSLLQARQPNLATPSVMGGPSSAPGDPRERRSQFPSWTGPFAALQGKGQPGRGESHLATHCWDGLSLRIPVSAMLAG